MFNAILSPDLPCEISEPKQTHSGTLRLQQHDTNLSYLTMHMSLVTLTTPPAALGQKGFANSDFDFQLKQRGLAKIIVVGTLASTCVEATARSGGERGYHLTMVRATGSVIAAPVRPRAARLPGLVL